MVIAPWLRPTDVIGAASAGAQAGLGRARIDTEGQEAADRLRFSYANLAQQAQEEAAKREMEGQLAAARLQQAAAQQAQLNQYRQGMLEARDRGLDIQEDRAGTSAAEKLIHAGTGIYGYNPKTDTLRTLREPSFALDPLQKHDLERASENLTSAQKLRQKAETPDEIEAAGTALAQAQNEYAKVRGALEPNKAAPLPTQGKGTFYAGPNTEKPAAAALSAQPDDEETPPEPKGAGLDAATKVRVAEQISRLHPDWTKAQVIEEVNKW